MSVTINKNPLREIPKRLQICMNKLDKFLVPPFAAMPGKEFVSALKDETGADAVSIFLVSENEPTKLVFAAGVGYKPEYHNSRYSLNGPFLTSYVCRERKPINASREQLEASKKQLDEGGDGIPYSGRCAIYIETRRFINIVAVPILFQDQCVGVLKLENKGETPTEKFPDEDFALAQILATYIAVAHKQRLYTELWGEGEQIKKQSRSLESYAQNIARILAKFLNAECASLFIKTQLDNGESILKYIGGVGYSEGYKNHVYRLDSSSSFTAHIAVAGGDAVMLTEGEIIKRGLPFTGKCIEYIESGSFRNIIAAPLTNDSDDLLAVLKVENKLPETLMFDDHDYEICKVFVDQQIIPTLTRFISSINNQHPSTQGISLLIKKLGPSQRRKGQELFDLVSKVKTLKKKEAGITGDDCAAYLQVSKPHFYRLIKKVR